MILRLLLSKKIFILIFGFSILTFLAHTAFTKTAIFADGKFYYSITRSIVKDRDIKFGNEYYSLGVTEKTQEGYVWNKYPPGVSLAWTPAFWITDGLVNLVNFTPGVQHGAEGFEIYYQTAVAITSIFLGTFGLYLVYQLLKDHFSDKVSILTTLALYGTTNLLFYISVEQINSHGVSFFCLISFCFLFSQVQRTKTLLFNPGNSWRNCRPCPHPGCCNPNSASSANPCQQQKIRKKPSYLLLTTYYWNPHRVPATDLLLEKDI